MPVTNPSMPLGELMQYRLNTGQGSLASQAVRRRIRARWERRRAETAGTTRLTLMSGRFLDMPQVRRLATTADTNLCLANPAFAERRYALVEKIGR